MSLVLALLLLSGGDTDPERWSDHPEADALHYDIRVAVDPVARRLEGEIGYLFRADRDLEVLRLDSLAGEGWTVTFRSPEGVALEAERHGDELWIRLPAAVKAGEEIRFKAEIAGTPPSGLFFKRTRDGEACALTDHFPALARGWLPCEDAPGDRATFSLRVEVPEGFQAVGTGDGIWEEGETRAWVASNSPELPTYLLAFAVAPYVLVREEGDARLVPHRVYAKDRVVAKKALKNHAKWMRMMEATFGPFLYSKYCVVQAPIRWGAMENAGNTFVMEDLFRGRRGGSGTLAHEFAHQWFGNAVGFSNWSEIWLSEGFASYLGPWLDAETGGPSLQRSMEGKRRQWLRSRVGRTLPVIWAGYEDPNEAINDNVYPKAAWILHMLRKELGDKAFFEAIRAYYLANRDGTASTRVLRAAFEKSGGRDLGWFFDQWLRRPGCPELKFEWQAEKVTVTQAQSGELFRFPLTLQWNDAAGQTTRRTVGIQKRVTELILDPPMRGGPVVDPDVELLYRRAR